MRFITLLDHTYHVEHDLEAIETPNRDRETFTDHAFAWCWTLRIRYKAFMRISEPHAHLGHTRCCETDLRNIQRVWETARVSNFEHTPSFAELQGRFGLWNAVGYPYPYLGYGG